MDKERCEVVEGKLCSKEQNGKCCLLDIFRHQVENGGRSEPKVSCTKPGPFWKDDAWTHLTEGTLQTVIKNGCRLRDYFPRYVARVTQEKMSSGEIFTISKT